jgi:hypothetical protein
MKSRLPPPDCEQTARQPPLGQTAMQPPAHVTLAEQLPSLALHEHSSKVAAEGMLRRRRQMRRLAARSLIIFSFQ